MSNNPNVKTETTNADINDLGNNTGIKETQGNISRFGQARQTLSNAGQTFKSGAGKVGRGVTTFASDATDYARTNPGKALAIAVGSGIAIGYLVGAATRRNTFWTSVSAAVLGAIADRVR